MLVSCSILECIAIFMVSSFTKWTILCLGLPDRKRRTRHITDSGRHKVHAFGNVIYVGGRRWVQLYLTDVGFCRDNR